MTTVGYHISIRRDRPVSVEEFRAASAQIGAEEFTGDGNTAEFKLNSGPL